MEFLLNFSPLGIFIVTILTFSLFQVRNVSRMKYQFWSTKVNSFKTVKNLFDPRSVTKFLGCGSYGFVFQVETTSKAEAAVKVVFESAQSETINEYKNLKDIRHPNIVQVYKCFDQQFTFSDLEALSSIKDAEVTDKIGEFKEKARKKGRLTAVCLRMELCGSNLRDWLRQTPFELSDSSLPYMQYQICQGIIKGLEFLHHNSILHRDLKPENIMFARGFELPMKIGDFGLCRLVNFGKSVPSLLTSRVGTPLYNPPEKFTKKYSFSADLYSMGLIIWEVIQLIKDHERAKMFEFLVFDEDTRQIKSHPQFVNVKDVVVNLTKRNHRERYQAISFVHLEFFPSRGQLDTAAVTEMERANQVHENLILKDIQIKSKSVAHMVAQIRVKQLGIKYAQDRMRKMILTNIKDKNDKDLYQVWVEAFTVYKDTCLAIDNTLKAEPIDRTGYPSMFNKTFLQISMALDWIVTRGEGIVDDIRGGRLYNNLENNLLPTLPRVEAPNDTKFWGNENSSVSSILLYGIANACGLLDGNIRFSGGASFSPFSHYKLPPELVGAKYPFGKEDGLLLFGDFQFGGHRNLEYSYIFCPEDASSSVGKATGLSTEQIRGLNTAAILSAYSNPENPYGYEGVLCLKGGVSKIQWGLIKGGDILLMGKHVALLADRPDEQGNVVTLQFTRDLDVGENKKCGGGWFPYNLVDTSKRGEVFVLRQKNVEPFRESSLLNLISEVDAKYHEKFLRGYPVDETGDCGMFL